MTQANLNPKLPTTQTCEPPNVAPSLGLNYGSLGLYCGIYSGSRDDLAGGNWREDLRSVQRWAPVTQVAALGSLFQAAVHAASFQELSPNIPKP